MNTPQFVKEDMAAKALTLAIYCCQEAQCEPAFLSHLVTLKREFDRSPEWIANASLGRRIARGNECENRVGRADEDVSATSQSGVIE